MTIVCTMIKRFAVVSKCLHIVIKNFANNANNNIFNVKIYLHDFVNSRFGRHSSIRIKYIMPTV